MKPGKTHSRRPAHGRHLFAALALAGLLLTCVCASANAAGWTLNPELSHLSFGSIKQGDTGESHYFKTLSGQVADSGKATVNIDTASVDTGIDIRNQRMRKVLFNVAEYPEAKITADVNMDAVSKLAPGDSTTSDTKASVSIAGQSHEMDTPLMVTRLSDNRIMVQPTRLIMLDASNFGLAKGIHKLREIAGLKEISTAVPVTFEFTFDEGQ